MLTQALEYLDRGWSVVPLKHKKAPCIDWQPYIRTKPSSDQVREWWTMWPDAWIGVALGPISDLIRIDADGVEAVRQLQLLGELPSTAEFVTPSGGRGWLYKCPPGLTKSLVPWTGANAHEEVRLQSQGAYTVVPPSPGYSWVNGQQVATAPRWIWDQAVKLELQRLEKEIVPSIVQPADHLVLEALQHLSPARCDSRDTWLRVGMALHSAGDQLLPAWVEWSSKSLKYMPGECEALWSTFRRVGGISARTILYWAREDGWRPPHFHELTTDVGNCRILARMCQGKTHYVKEWDTWMSWCGTHWKQKGELEVMAIAKQAVADRRERACKSLLKLGLEDKQKAENIIKIIKWCHASESSARLHAAVDLARSEPNVVLDYTMFNKRPWLFNCPNGTIELNTGILRPADPEDYLTQMCPVEYDTTATAPRWEKFLTEVFEGNTELIPWLQRFFGYCLTGHIREHILPIFYGTGRNGKTTIIKTVCSVIGSDYAGTTPSGFLVQTKGEQHPTKIADLYSKRLAADLETDADARLNETLIKRLTGGDDLKARRMHEDFWEFTPTHKLVLATNHEPGVQGTDTAIWSRLKLVPFLVSFAGREDRSLVDTLQAESKGILRWMVEGCELWVKHGLGEPAAIQKATSEYRSEQNDVAKFLAACYRPNDTCKARKTAVTSKYTIWCRDNHAKQVNSKAFGMELRKLGVKGDHNYYFLEEIQ